MGTFSAFSVSLIVAVSMKNTFVTQFITSSCITRSNVVNFHLIIILEEQSTPATFPFLLSEQNTQCSTKHIVVAESLTPVHEISIIGTSSSFYFRVSLDMRMAVIPEF